MTEIMGRVSQDGRVELVDDHGTKISAVEPMTPQEAAFFARGILACAISLCSATPPAPGEIVGDADLAVTKWVVGPSLMTNALTLILSIPPGINLSFGLTPQGAVELGRALTSQGQGSTPAEPQSGTIH
jgi:hypothetical protein